MRYSSECEHHSFVKFGTFFSIVTIVPFFFRHGSQGKFRTIINPCFLPKRTKFLPKLMAIPAGLICGAIECRSGRDLSCSVGAGRALACHIAAGGGLCLRARNLVGERWRKCRFRDQWQECAVLAAGDHLQEALAWILFRHPDNDAKEREEFVSACPISADRHGRVPASISRDRSSSLVVAANSTATILKMSRAVFESSINKYFPPLLAGPQRMPNVYILCRKDDYCQSGT
jgi:hypothetical protein